MSTDHADGNGILPAPLGTRILAGIVDFAVVLAGAAILLPPTFGYFPALFVAYHTFSIWLVGKTPGKALLALEVRRISGPPSLLWALGRSSIGLCLVNGFGVGILFALRDPLRRALHDRAFGSVVVGDEAAIGVPLRTRLQEWARRQKAVYEKKTETIAVLAGVWSFLEWIAGKVQQAVDWTGRALTTLRSRAHGVAAQALPAAPTAAQAAAVAVGCSTVTTLVLATVPGAGDVARAVASPVATYAGASRPAVRVVRGPAGGGTHVALAGQPVEIRAGLEVRHYTVDFGDGSEPERGSLVDQSVLSVRHEYEVSSPGTSYDVVIIVADDQERTVGRAEYRVEFVGTDDDARVPKAIADGLWWLHRTQVHDEHPTDGSMGHWGSGNPVGETALAALAFEVNGFQGRGAREDAYRDTVARALAFLLSQCVTVPIEPQRAGNPDSNGNGIGIATAGDRPLYEAPLVAMALLASRQPRAVAATGPAGVRGRRYADIVADILDFIAFAQYDADGPARGGWRYAANTDADLSVTQWPALAMMAGEEVGGLDAPDWVRTELRDHFLTSVQDETSGGFGYQGSATPTLGMTAAGLISLGFAGVSEDDRRVRRAVDFIAQNWDAPDGRHYYAMYTLMKAAKLRNRPIARFGDRDWQSEYRQRLLQDQNDDGSWPATGGYGTPVLDTAWPVLILSEDVFAESRLAGALRWLREAF